MGAAAKVVAAHNAGAPEAHPKVEVASHAATRADIAPLDSNRSSKQAGSTHFPLQ